MGSRRFPWCAACHRKQGTPESIGVSWMGGFTLGQWRHADVPSREGGAAAGGDLLDGAGSRQCALASWSSH